MAKPRPHPQSSTLVLAFGVPNAFINRRIQPLESAIAVVEGEAMLKAKASGP